MSPRWWGRSGCPSPPLALHASQRPHSVPGEWGIEVPVASEVRWSQGVGGCRAGCLAGRRRGATAAGKYHQKPGSSAAFGGSPFMAEKTAEQGDGTTLQGSAAQLRKPQPQLRVLPMFSSNIHVACHRPAPVFRDAPLDLGHLPTPVAWATTHPSTPPPPKLPASHL